MRNPLLLSFFILLLLASCSKDDDSTNSFTIKAPRIFDGAWQITSSKYDSVDQIVWHDVQISFDEKGQYYMPATPVDSIWSLKGKWELESPFGLVVTFNDTLYAEYFYKNEILSFSWQLYDYEKKRHSWEFLLKRPK